MPQFPCGPPPRTSLPLLARSPEAAGRGRGNHGVGVPLLPTPCAAETNGEEMPGTFHLTKDLRGCSLPALRGIPRERERERDIWKTEQPVVTPHPFHFPSLSTCSLLFPVPTSPPVALTVQWRHAATRPGPHFREHRDGGGTRGQETGQGWGCTYNTTWSIRAGDDGRAT